MYRIGDIFGVAKISNILGVLEIPDIFGCEWITGRTLSIKLTSVFKKPMELYTVSIHTLRGKQVGYTDR